MRMSSPTSDVLDLILHFNNTEQYGLTSDGYTLKPVQATLSCELEASWSVCRGGIFMRVGKTSCILGKHPVEGKTTEGLLNCSSVRFIHLPSSLCLLSPHSVSHSTVYLPLWAVIVYKPVYIRTGLWHRKESHLFWHPQQLVEMLPHGNLCRPFQPVGRCPALLDLLWPVIPYCFIALPFVSFSYKTVSSLRAESGPFTLVLLIHMK